MCSAGRKIDPLVVRISTSLRLQAFPVIARAECSSATRSVNRMIRNRRGEAGKLVHAAYAHNTTQCTVRGQDLRLEPGIKVTAGQQTAWQRQRLPAVAMATQPTRQPPLLLCLPNQSWTKIPNLLLTVAATRPVGRSAQNCSKLSLRNRKDKIARLYAGAKLIAGWFMRQGLLQA